MARSGSGPCSIRARSAQLRELRLGDLRCRGVAFAVDLAAGAEAKTGKQGHGWAPALDRILTERGEGKGRQQRESGVDRKAQHDAGGTRTGGGDLQGQLRGKLGVKLAPPRRSRSRSATADSQSLEHFAPFAERGAQCRRSWQRLG